jgi:hypothetical protein
MLHDVSKKFQKLTVALHVICTLKAFRFVLELKKKKVTRDNSATESSPKFLTENLNRMLICPHQLDL